MVPWSAIGVVLSALILLATGYNLYLSHFKQGSSDIEIQPQSLSSSGFSGGSSERWEGNSLLKFINNGEITGVLVDHRVEVEFLYNSPADDGSRERDQPHQDVHLYIPDHMDRLPKERRIQPGDVVDFKQHLRIEGVDRIENYDAIGIRHRVIVEDNTGRYNTSTVNLLGLTGPDL